jgi:3-methyl-2-oxobutanoate hydroxymethyltransferase
LQRFDETGAVMSPSKIHVPDLKEKKSRGEKIAMLTAYDATMARLMDQAGVDAILVGDSVGMVVLGYDNTLAVTLDDMLHHTRAVVRGASRALIVTDMPFLSYQVSVEEAVRNAGRLLQEGGASAVKLEGGRPVIDAVRRMVDVGIPVMGHLGLQPQSVNQVGGYLKQATRPQEADALVADALALQDAGAFAIVLESIPEEVAKTATTALDIPTIGIGAGPHCDGQVLVSYDMLGLFDRFVPSFVKQYATMADSVRAATRAYVDDVHEGRYPLSLSKISGIPKL